MTLNLKDLSLAAATTAIAVSLAACGGPETTTTSTTTTSTVTTPATPGTTETTTTTSTVTPVTPSTEVLRLFLLLPPLVVLLLLRLQQVRPSPQLLSPNSKIRPLLLADLTLNVL